MNKRIGIIGLGRMGQALAMGFLSSGALKPRDILACVRTEKALSNCSALGVEGVLELRPVVENCELIFLCVRSNQAVAVAKELGLRADETRHFSLISMCAGVPLVTLNVPGISSTQLLKAIANVNIQTCDGLSVLFAEQRTEAYLKVKWLLEQVGMVVDSPTEAACDKASTLSATIPAFISSMISALIAGGIECGVPRELSQTITIQVTEGTARSIQRLGLSPENYQEMVTSPGGVVIKGVQILESKHLRSTYIEALTQVARLVRHND